MDDDRDEGAAAPWPVVGAVAAGVAPLPFLAVYAVVFVVHGTVHPVQPPDITNSKTGELVAGLVAVALFALGILVLGWFLRGRRRWPFALAQAATLAAAIGLLTNPDSGGAGVAVLLAVTSAAALVFAALPASWAHVGRSVPGLLRERRHEDT